MANIHNKVNSPNFPYNLSYKEKKKSDFAAAKAMMDYYNMISTVTPERIRKFEENINLHRGAWPEIENLSPTTNVSIYGENVTLGGGKLYHFPMINIVSQAQVSDLIGPFIPIIRDTSTKARNHRDEVRANKVKSYFETNVITPKIDALKMQFQGQPIPKEIEDQIQQAVMSELPDSVIEGLDEYKMPDELLIELLYKHVIEDQKVRYKFDSGADFAITNAEEYYLVGMDSVGPKFKLLNAKWVESGGSDDNEFTQDGEWAKYTEYMTFPDFIAKFGASVKFSKLEEIIDLYSPIPGSGGKTEAESGIDLDVLDVIGSNSDFQNPGSDLYIDVKTMEGQERLKKLYQNLSGKHKSGSGIKVVYITWRWNRIAKLVEDVQGKERIEDEHYVKNPARGDKKVEKILLPQVWHGYLINDQHYVEVEPVPWQYDNLNNPFKPKLPIHGIKYNTYMSNTKNSSIVDLGKPFNFRINVLLKKMQEYESTDIGKVLFLTQDVKPDKMSWGQWYSSLFQSRVALLNTKYEGASVQMKSPLMMQDLSRTSEISACIEKLRWLEEKLIRAMHYNPAKFGDIGQYSTNDNVKQSLAGVDKQMLRFIKKRRELKIEVCTSLLNVTIASYKDNDYMKELLLDDYLKAYYEINVEPFSASSLSLYLVDDFEESTKLETMRQLALSIIQNGGSAKDIALIVSADSMAEIEEVLGKSDKKKAEEINAQRKHEAELAEKNNISVENQLKLKQQYDSLEAERERQVKLKMAALNASLMSNAQDIDKNNIADSLQSTTLKIKSEEKLHADEMAIERLKLAQKK